MIEISFSAHYIVAHLAGLRRAWLLYPNDIPGTSTHYLMHLLPITLRLPFSLHLTVISCRHIYTANVAYLHGTLSCDDSVDYFIWVSMALDMDFWLSDFLLIIQSF